MAGAAGTLTRSGTFVWEELTTNDVGAARAFYAKVLGWDVTEEPIDDDNNYTMFIAGGARAAGAFQMAEMPPNWSTYIGVESADEAAARAKELGATIVREPFDVMEQGRMAVLQDPTGAFINVWQAKANQGATADGHGTVEWRELRTGDIEAAKRFYGEWLGWTFESQDMGDFIYHLIVNGDQQIGGMFQMTPDMGEMPPHWGVTFEVDDIDAVYKNATALGARTMMEPQDIPGVGRYAGMADPQGAAFGVMKPTSS